MANLKPPPARPTVVQEPEKSPVVHKKPTISKTVVEAARPKKPTEQAPPDAIKPLQLKIPEGKKNEFKAYAAMHGLSMNALFLDMFEEYKEKHA
jgi:hypothetical protein